jgi:hypothetical protein
MSRAILHCVGIPGCSLGVVILSAALVVAQATSSISFTFTSFDYPGAIATQPLGINKAGTIVGYYVDASFVSHGFARLQNGTFIRIDYPGSTETLLFGINDSNQVVGFYTGTSTLAQGFLLLHGNDFTPIAYPGASATTRTESMTTGRSSAPGVRASPKEASRY